MARHKQAQGAGERLVSGERRSLDEIAAEAGGSLDLFVLCGVSSIAGLLGVWVDLVRCIGLNRWLGAVSRLER